MGGEVKGARERRSTWQLLAPPPPETLVSTYYHLGHPCHTPAVTCCHPSGDIVAIGGLKDVVTGETLCDEKNPIILERMDFPDPVIKIAIEPKSKGDLEKMGVGLNKLAQEDPSFNYSRDEETGQTVIEGMGELHLEIIVDRLRREFKVGGGVIGVRV